MVKNLFNRSKRNKAPREEKISGVASSENRSLDDPSSGESVESKSLSGDSSGYDGSAELSASRSRIELDESKLDEILLTQLDEFKGYETSMTELLAAGLKGAAKAVEKIETVRTGMEEMLDTVFHEDLRDCINERCKTVMVENIRYATQKISPPTFENDPVYYYSSMKMAIKLVGDFVVQSQRAISGLAEDKVDTFFGVVKAGATGLMSSSIRKEIKRQDKRVDLIVQVMSTLGKAMHSKLDELPLIAPGADNAQFNELMGLLPDSVQDRINTRIQEAGISVPKDEILPPEEDKEGYIPPSAESVSVNDDDFDDAAVAEGASGFTAKILKVVMNKKEQWALKDSDVDSLISSAHAVDSIVEKFRRFNESKKTVKDMFNFAMDLRDDLKTLRGKGGAAFSKISFELKKEYFSVLLKINLMFERAIVAAEDSGMQMCVKPNVVSRILIRSMAERFARFVGDQGYAFPEMHRYPYVYAIAASHARRLAHADPESQHYRIWKSIADDAANEVFRYEAKNAQTKDELKREYLADIKIQAGNVLLEHISKLQDENKEDYSKSREHKIVLVQKLFELITVLKPEEVDQKNIFQVAQAKLNKWDAEQASLGRWRTEQSHLLWDGRTREVTAKIEAVCTTPADCVTRINLSLYQLEEEVWHQGSTIFHRDVAGLNAPRIEAIKTLRDLMQIPGVRIADALNALLDERPDLLRVLYEKDSVLIERLEKMDEFIPRIYFDKYNVDETLKLKNIVSPPTVVSDPVKQIRSIDERIRLLETERTHLFGFFSEPVSAQKIHCLKGLRNLVEGGKPVQEALKSMLDDRATWPDAHLLHHGKTGKVIRELLTVPLSAADVIQRIDAEMTRLQEKRAAPMFFFPKTRKSSLEHHIAALETLKELMGPDKNAAEAFGQLSLETRTLLIKDSGALLEQIGISVTESLRLEPKRLPGLEAG